MRDLVHIHQTAELAERVLLPGDPGRAMRLAQALLDQPKMLNHNRGLWGYSGAAVDGAPLSIQSTGMGGPSVAIVTSELVELGARRLLRVGTCGALDPALALGQAIVVSEAICDDGTSAALSGCSPLTRLAAPGTLTQALIEAADGAHESGADDAHESGGNGAAMMATSGAVISTDLFYDAEDQLATWLGSGARAVEMEAATLFALAAKRGVEAGCLLVVSNSLVGGQPPYISADALYAAEIELGRLALHALA